MLIFKDYLCTYLTVTLNLIARSLHNGTKILHGEVVLFILKSCTAVLQYMKMIASLTPVWSILKKHSKGSLAFAYSEFRVAPVWSLYDLQHQAMSLTLPCPYVKAVSTIMYVVGQAATSIINEIVELTNMLSRGVKFICFSWSMACI